MRKYDELCRRVEETANLHPTTAGDYELLSTLIFRRTGKVLSATTLKRIWGYLDEPLSTRRSTLDILARFSGWTAYLDFMKGNEPELESGPVGAKTISTDNLKAGARLRLMWPPSRVCVVEYCSRGRWEVIESAGTRLSKGDTFSCHTFVDGEPLYLDNLLQGSEPRGVYVCGRKSGIRFMEEE